MADDDTAVDESRIVKAGADKGLFLRTFTKDIDLIPAISDLVDNSVDGALDQQRIDEQGADVADHSQVIDMTGYEITVSLGSDHFSIVDNCGGIDIDAARNYAFRFGRSGDETLTPGGTGRFGVGMKRALFKIGRHFRIESSSAASAFTLDVNIEKWAKHNDWFFELEDVQEGADYEPIEALGTEIEITSLYKDAASTFSSDEFPARLRLELGMNHQRPLTEGLAITVNDRPVRPYDPKLAASDEVVPINRTNSVRTSEGTVRIGIVAGIAAEEVGDDPEPENRTTQERAGWYLYCNRRLVLAANKTFLTGWGDTTARYHPQYRAFRGFCYLTAENPAALPWNTTKTGVDASDPVFLRAKKEMSLALKEVQSALNSLKKERQQVSQPKKRRLESALRSATPIRPQDVPPSRKLSVPGPTPSAAHEVNVLYQVERSRMDEVQDFLGVTSAAEAGRQTFEYFYRSEIE